jgi:hypothetical protein
LHGGHRKLRLRTISHSVEMLPVLFSEAKMLLLTRNRTNSVDSVEAPPEVYELVATQTCRRRPKRFYGQKGTRAEGTNWYRLSTARTTHRELPRRGARPGPEQPSRGRTGRVAPSYPRHRSSDPSSSCMGCRAESTIGHSLLTGSHRSNTIGACSLRNFPWMPIVARSSGGELSVAMPRQSFTSSLLQPWVESPGF